MASARNRIPKGVFDRKLVKFFEDGTFLPAAIQFITLISLLQKFSSKSCGLFGQIFPDGSASKLAPVTNKIFPTLTFAASKQKKRHCRKSSCLALVVKKLNPPQELIIHSFTALRPRRNCHLSPFGDLILPPSFPSPSSGHQKTVTQEAKSSKKGAKEADKRVGRPSPDRITPPLGHSRRADQLPHTANNGNNSPI